MKLTYIDKGKTGSVEASDAVFAAAWNPGLVKQAILAIQSNRRANTAHAKDRSAVRGADTKPWRQKGTGRARHGSIYSPIWKGGGVTFGPLNERNYTKKVNRKARKAALRSALSYLVANDNLSVANELSFDEPKTKEAVSFIATTQKGLKKDELANKSGHALAIVVDNPTASLKKSFRNLKNVTVISVADLNVEDAMLPRHLIVLGKDSVKALEERLG